MTKKGELFTTLQKNNITVTDKITTKKCLSFAKFRNKKVMTEYHAFKREKVMKLKTELLYV